MLANAGQEVLKITRYNPDYYPALKSVTGLSTVGYYPNYHRNLSLAIKADFHYSISSVITHEAGHAIGFSHEFIIPNRDQYINYTGAEAEAINSRNSNGYDWGSVMNYEVSSLFSPKTPFSLSYFVGNLPLLSEIDILGSQLIHWPRPIYENPNYQAWAIKSQVNSKYLTSNGSSVTLGQIPAVWFYVSPLLNISAVNNTVTLQNGKLIRATSVPGSLPENYKHLQSSGVTIGAMNTYSSTWVIDYQFYPQNIPNKQVATIIWNRSSMKCLGVNANGSLQLYAQISTNQLQWPNQCAWILEYANEVMLPTKI